MKLDLNDSNGKINRKLQRKFNVNLFDLAYTLAIALTKEFIQVKFYGLTGHEKKSLKESLEKTIEKLKDFPIAQAAKIKELRQLNVGIPDSQRGRRLSEKTRIILLWSQFLVKYKAREKKPEEVTDEEIEKRLVYFRSRLGSNVKRSDVFETESRLVVDTELNWNDYDTLIRWFSNKLKTCKYLKLLKIKSDKEKEIENAKSLLQKNAESYGNSAKNEKITYIMKQLYFDRRERELQNKKFKRAIAILKVEFKINSIVILERIGTKVKKNEYILNVRNYFEKETTSLKEDPKIEKPIVIFPDEEEFIIDNYIQPCIPFHDGSLKLKEFTKALFSEEEKKKETPANKN